jgi:CBS-domain-containing membrane protein
LSAAFTLVTGFVSIAVMATAAHLARAPMIFPSLGPTAFLFFYTPLAPAASPRNTIIGHAIGAAAGWMSLAALGLLDDGPALVSGVSWAYVFAASAALALTASVMALLDAPHPPAGATTLIVALGLLTEVNELLILMAAVVLLTVQAFVINRAAGLPYPTWSVASEAEAASSDYRPV